MHTELTLRDVAEPYHTRPTELDEISGAGAWLYSSRLRTLFFAVVVAISYYLGTKIGFAFTPEQQPISTFWPPNAALLAALLLAPRRRWWVLLLAVLPAHLLSQLQAGVPLALALGWFVGNSAEALLGAACIRCFLTRERLFETVRGVIVFLVFGVMVAPLATTFLDAAVVVITGGGNNYWPLWAARLFSNMLAELTLVPVIVLLGLKGRTWIRHANLARLAEAATLALMIVLVSMLVFGTQQPPHNSIPPLLYLPLPLLLWASVRSGLGGMSASLLVISLISIWNAMHGRGPFSTASMQENVLSLQVLLLVIALPLMLLTAFIREHRMLEHMLRQAGGKLIDSAERERRNVAEEMHHEIGRPLATLAQEVGRLKTATGAIPGPQFDELYDRVSRISETVQNLSEKIYSSQLERMGIAVTLRDLCQKTSMEAGSLEIDLIQEELPEDLSSRISLCLYRVAEEALQNLIRHSRARKAVVELKVRRQRLLLRIVDDGVGWSPKNQPATGLGISSMRERARAAGGALEIVSRPMRGTMVELSVPLKHAPTNAD
jgi:two-component system sensor histidine kinase UhpB